MARGIYHGPFWHELGLSSKGECPSCQLKHPPACRKSRSQHCHCTEQTKERGGGNQKGLTGASQRCAQPCQQLSYILAGQAQSSTAQKLCWSLEAEKHPLPERRFWLEIVAGGSEQDSSAGEHGWNLPRVAQCWCLSGRSLDGGHSLLLVLFFLLYLRHRDISWPCKEGTWLGLGKISSQTRTKPVKSTVFQQITNEKGSEGTHN